MTARGGNHRQGAAPRLTVELVGIPGAGKSHLARVLADGLARCGVAVHQPQELMGPATPTGTRLARKAAACCAAAVGHPLMTARVVRAVVGSGQPGRAELTGRVVQWLVAQHVAISAQHRAGVSILDEGVVQCLWSIGLRGEVGPVLRTLAAARRPVGPDLLVVVEVSPECALTRLATRPSAHSRVQRLPEDERLEELVAGARLLERLVSWWSCEARAGTEVVTVRGAVGADDHGALVDRLRAALEHRRLRPGGLRRFG